MNPDNVSRLEYTKLINPYTDVETLKKDIVTSIWNDERLLREDIRNIAEELIRELNYG